MSDLPRLLICCFDVVPGPHATSRRLTEYLKGLSERYQVVALTVKTPETPHIERYQGARLLRVPVGSGDLRDRMEAFDRAVRRQLESEEYVLVHFFDPVSGYPLCEKREEHGFGLVYDATRFPSGDLPSMHPGEGSNKRLLARSRRRELFCLMNADAVIVGSEATRQHVESLGVPHPRVHVLRAPVDLAAMQPATRRAPDGVPVRLLHLGSHGRHQDLPLLLEAMTKTRERVRLALVGPSSPELTPGLKARAAELGLSERVDVLPAVAHDELHKALSAADVGVVSLSDEPRNRSTTALARVGDYLAAGRPVLAADTAASRELCPSAATRFYPPGQLDGLVAAIDALSSPEVRRELGTAALAEAPRYDAQHIREALWAVYAKVAPNADAPRDAPRDALGTADATQLGAPHTDDRGDVTQAGVFLPGGSFASEPRQPDTSPAAPAPAVEPDTGPALTLAAARSPAGDARDRDEPTRIAIELTDLNVPVVADPAAVAEGPAPLVTREAPQAEAPAAAGVEVAAALRAPPADDATPQGSFDEASAGARPLANAPTDALAKPTTADQLSGPAPAGPLAQAPPLGAPSTAGPASLSPATSSPAPARVDPPPSARPSVAAADAVAVAPPATALPSEGASRGATAVAPGPAAPGAPAQASPATPGPSTAEAAPSSEAPGPAPSPSTRTPAASSLPALAPRAAPAPLSPETALPTAAPSEGPPRPAFVGAPDDEPLDFSTLIRPSVPNPPQAVAAPAAGPDGPAPATRPRPIPVPTSFGAPSGAALAGSAAGASPAPPRGPSAAAPSEAPRPRAQAAAPPPLPRPMPSAPAPLVTAAAATMGSVAARPVPPRPLESGRPMPEASRRAAGASRSPGERPAPVYEVSDDDVELINDESFLSLHDGDEAGEVLDGDLEAVEASAAPPPSRLDPWFVQLVHGYCPPESPLFNRHVPPTTTPGKRRA
ncbi:MAG: glycosyltransferase [Myxococcaceae bacterium]|nr:glycosyltransferase [Myxococcaceae bacterium]